MPARKRLSIGKDIRVRLALIAVIPATVGMITWPAAWAIVTLAQR
jgi:hypothetical protein